MVWGRTLETSPADTHSAHRPRHVNPLDGSADPRVRPRAALLDVGAKSVRNGPIWTNSNKPQGSKYPLRRCLGWMICDVLAQYLCQMLPSKRILLLSFFHECGRHVGGVPRSSSKRILLIIDTVTHAPNGHRALPRLLSAHQHLSVHATPEGEPTPHRAQLGAQRATRATGEAFWFENDMQ